MPNDEQAVDKSYFALGSMSSNYNKQNASVDIKNIIPGMNEHVKEVEDSFSGERTKNSSASLSSLYPPPPPVLPATSFSGVSCRTYAGALPPPPPFDGVIKSSGWMAASSTPTSFISPTCSSNAPPPPLATTGVPMLPSSSVVPPPILNSGMVLPHFSALTPPLPSSSIAPPPPSSSTAPPPPSSSTAPPPPSSSTAPPPPLSSSPPPPPPLHSSSSLSIVSNNSGSFYSLSSTPASILSVGTSSALTNSNAVNQDTLNQPNFSHSYNRPTVILPPQGSFRYSTACDSLSIYKKSAVVQPMPNINHSPLLDIRGAGGTTDKLSGSSSITLNINSKVAGGILKSSSSSIYDVAVNSTSSTQTQINMFSKPLLATSFSSACTQDSYSYTQNSYMNSFSTPVSTTNILPSLSSSSSSQLCISPHTHQQTSPFPSYFSSLPYLYQVKSGSNISAFNFNRHNSTSSMYGNYDGSVSTNISGVAIRECSSGGVSTPLNAYNFSTSSNFSPMASSSSSSVSSLSPSVAQPNYNMYNTTEYSNAQRQFIGGGAAVNTYSNFPAGVSANNSVLYTEGSSVTDSVASQSTIKVEDHGETEGKFTESNILKDGKDAIAAEVMKVLFNGADVSSAAIAILNSMENMGLLNDSSKLTDCMAFLNDTTKFSNSEDKAPNNGTSADNSTNNAASLIPSAGGNNAITDEANVTKGCWNADSIGEQPKMVIDEEIMHLNVEMEKLDDSFLDPNRFPYAYRWYYLDMKQQCQGPFDTLIMIKWFLAGYFKETTQMRRNDELGFTPIDNGFRLKEAAHKTLAAARAIPSNRAPVATAPYRSLAPPPPPTQPMSLKIKLQNAQAALAPLFNMAKKHQRSMPSGPEIIKKKKKQPRENN